MGRLEDGALVLDRFVIQRTLANDRTADVYSAVHRGNRDPALVKVLRSDASSLNAQRFEREARLLSQISHPNVTKLLAYGLHEGQPCLITEATSGERLDTIIERERAIAWQQAVKWTLHVLSGLDAMHRGNVVHRDVRPRNIVVSSDGYAKLTNLGMATMLTGQTTITIGDEFPENLYFAAPERVIDGAPASTQSDIFSLGVTFYRMLSGALPYWNTDKKSAIAAYEEPASAPMALPTHPEIPAALSAVILNAIMVDPTDRIASCRTFSSDIRTAVRTRSDDTRRLLLDSVPPSASAASIASTAGGGSSTAPTSGRATSSRRRLMRSDRLSSDRRDSARRTSGPPADATHILGAQPVGRPTSPGGVPARAVQAPSPQDSRTSSEAARPVSSQDTDSQSPASLETSHDVSPFGPDEPADAMTTDGDTSPRAFDLAQLASDNDDEPRISVGSPAAMVASPSAAEEDASWPSKPLPRDRQGKRVRSLSAPVLGLRTARKTGRHPATTNPLPPEFVQAKADHEQTSADTPLSPYAPISNGGLKQLEHARSLAMQADKDLPIDYRAQPKLRASSSRRLMSGSATLRQGGLFGTSNPLPADVELPPLRRFWAVVACHVVEMRYPIEQVAELLTQQLKGHGGVRIIDEDLFVIMLSSEDHRAAVEMVEAVENAVSAGFDASIRMSSRVSEDPSYQALLEHDRVLPAEVNAQIAQLLGSTGSCQQHLQKTTIS